MKQTQSLSDRCNSVTGFGFADRKWPGWSEINLSNIVWFMKEIQTSNCTWLHWTDMSGDDEQLQFGGSQYSPRAGCNRIAARNKDRIFLAKWTKLFIVVILSSRNVTGEGWEGYLCNVLMYWSVTQPQLPQMLDCLVVPSYQVPRCIILQKYYITREDC